MENTIEYKGYIGQFHYEEGDEAFHGIVLGLRDVIHFQGTCVSELKGSLQESVADYLAWCVAEGVAPEKPYTGRFIVRVDPDLHRTISVRARSAGQSLNQWVAEALAREAMSDR
jgi:predicted HicB family RNase H-like nuclease